MTTQINIDIMHGSASVEDTDRERAEAAALEALEAFEWRAGEPLRIDPAEAYAAFVRHMSAEDYNRTPRDTILIAAWEAAERAANAALTQGWYNPTGAICALSV